MREAGLHWWSAQGTRGLMIYTLSSVRPSVEAHDCPVGVGGREGAMGGRNRVGEPKKLVVDVHKTHSGKMSRGKWGEGKPTVKSVSGKTDLA